MPSPTLRGYSYMIAGGVLLFAGVGGIGYPYTLIISLIILGHLYLSYILASAYEASLSAARVERRPEATSVREGSETKVSIIVRETTGRGVPRVVVEDALPPRLRLTRGTTRYIFSLPSSGTVRLHYYVRPYVGLHVFKPLRVSGGDLLGLFEASMRFKAKTLLRAYPAYEDLVRETFRSPIPYMGVSKSRRRGLGYDFYELRDYEPGDDVRKIVWTASARMGRLIVREDEAETRLRLMILVDASSAAWLGPPGDAPIDHIARSAATIAASVAGRGGELGYMIYDGLGWHVSPPATGAWQLDRLLHELASIQPPRHRGVYRLGDAVEEASLYAGTGILVILAGWMIFREYEVSKLVSSVKGTWGRTILAIVLPSRVDDPLSEAAARLEAWWYKRNHAVLVKGGVVPVLARGWLAVPALLSAVGGVVRSLAY